MAELPTTVPDGIPDIAKAPVQTDSLAQVIAQTPAQVEQLATELKRSIVQGYINGWNLAWNKASGLTPKQFFRALGTKSVSFLVRGASLKRYIEAEFPELVGQLPGVPEIYTVTPNQDGSVSVVEKD